MDPPLSPFASTKEEIGENLHEDAARALHHLKCFQPQSAAHEFLIREPSGNYHEAVNSGSPISDGH